MIKIMFLCIGNSCRSQMAEGLAREFGKGILEPFSAGVIAAGVHHRAIMVMKELGIDISRQSSKEADESLLATMDLIVALCEHAKEECSRTPPGVKLMRWPVRDPVRTRGKEEIVMNDFRRARDEIREKLQEFMKTLHE